MASTNVNIDMQLVLDDITVEKFPQIKDSYYDGMIRSTFDNTLTDLDDISLLNLLTMKPIEMDIVVDRNLVDRNQLILQFTLFIIKLRGECRSKEIYSMLTLNRFDYRLIEFLSKHDEDIDIFDIILRNDKSILTENQYQICQTLAKCSNDPDLLIKLYEHAGIEICEDIIQSNLISNLYETDIFLKACGDKKLTALALALLATDKFDPGHIYSGTKNSTPLNVSCNAAISEVALALIATGQSNPRHVDANGHSALISACFTNMPKVALALIATGESDPGQIETYGNTALIYACMNNMTEVALALIATGESKPAHTNTEGNTALIIACKYEIPTVALALIATGESDPGHVDANNSTALMHACYARMSAVALALIATGQSNPGHSNKNCATALMLSIYNNMLYNNMPEVALALIATGQPDPGPLAGNMNALIYACFNKMTEVALALIATGKIDLAHTNTEGSTALMVACSKKMTRVALALIATGKSDPKHVDKKNRTALKLATENNIQIVMDKLNELNIRG